MNYGRAIKFVRNAKALSQTSVARSSGLTPSYISLIECGRREPSLKALQALATALDVPLYLLMLLASSDDELRGISREQAELLSRDLLEIALGGASTRLGRG